MVYDMIWFLCSDAEFAALYPCQLMFNCLCRKTGYTVFDIVYASWIFFQMNLPNCIHSFTALCLLSWRMAGQHSALRQSIHSWWQVRQMYGGSAMSIRTLVYVRYWVIYNCMLSCILNYISVCVCVCAQVCMHARALVHICI